MELFGRVGGERHPAQFRLEVYNLTNTTTLGTPVSNINAANFGQITTLRTGTSPRRIQLGVKLYF